MVLPTTDIAAVPTFIGSGILFLASGTMVVTCTNSMFEKDPTGVFKYQTITAHRLRERLLNFSLFLIIAYGVLFATFFIHQVLKMFELPTPPYVGFLLDDGTIYIMQISLFPSAVLFAAFLVRTYILIRRT